MSIYYQIVKWLKDKGFELGEAHPLARNNYVPRLVGNTAAFIVVALLVLERGWSAWYFPFMIYFFLIHPQLVLLASKVVPGTKKIEIGAMMIDSFIMGLWIPYINFFLWGSFSFLLANIITHGIIGGFRQILKAQLPFIMGIILGIGMTGVTLEPDAPFYIEATSMILLLLYMINLGGTFYEQNIRIKKLSNNLGEKNNALNETIAELKSAREELVEKAHKAGMADLATGVLHNIGNVLNSVNISATQIKETLSRSKFPQFRQANELLAEHRDDLEAFLLEDPRGLQLLNYYLKLEDPLGEEREQLKAHSERLTEKVQLMTEVIDAQQDVARVVRIKEEFQLEEVVEDTLMLQSGTIERDSLEIVKDFADTAKVVAQKSKLVHILINLLQNAKDAMSGMDAGQKRIRIRTYGEGEEVCLSVSDNGEGIREEHLKKIFAHGFTTREKGHGYGLHTCANYMSEMEGGIRAESEGKGKGATFILTFPPAGQKERKTGFEDSMPPGNSPGQAND
ncbi:MASE2 domain-containing protein [Fodinibius roseus]|uniref:histidine kinase n=1 Tax=Fodinibius roseus TaxID=1194090 RepID=A0A1M5DIE5_9BACT|nr:ATP-binding protein [Fodinibius roseus]SHF66522.1 MASE2 domain-containing protein [Fodinibius roseus]